VLLSVGASSWLLLPVAAMRRRENAVAVASHFVPVVCVSGW